MDVTSSQFSFSALSSEDLQLYNVVLGTYRELPLELHGQSYRFVFEPGAASTGDGTLHFKAKLDQKTFWLGVSPAPAVELFDESLAGCSLEDLPPDASRLLIESFCSDILSDLEASLGMHVSVETATFTASQEPFDDIVRFSIKDDAGNVAYRGYLAMSRYMLEFLADKLRLVPSVPYHDYQDIPFKGRILVGNTRVSVEDYKALEINDVILFDNKNTPQGPFCLSFRKNFAFQIQYDNSQATITHMTDTTDNLDDEVFEDEADLEQEEEVASPPPASMLPVDELPVRLTFEVGRKNVALNELQSLNSGYTFELENPIERPVTIRANGAAVGIGELVQVGQKMGVRVVELKN